MKNVKLFNLGFMGVRSIFVILFLFWMLNLKAERALYVDDFENIVGNTTAENDLLSYAQLNEIETLLLYGLHVVHSNYDLTNSVTNIVLADFIKKAKNNYGILKVGATAENDDFFTNVIDVYNNTRSLASEKFDIYNLEFEYWISSATDPGGYYCTTYLTPGGYTCDENGAFQFFINVLQIMNALATNNTHAISTEAYVGWPTAVQASTISGNLDRLRLHAYVTDPVTSFNYAETRMIDFANGTPGLNVSIIFSSEPIFMQNWLENNSMLSAENIFINDWMANSISWINNINVEGFTYFAYSHMANVNLPTELNYFQGRAINNSVELNWGTASEINFDYFEVERKTSGNDFFRIGKINSEGNSVSLHSYQFVDRDPSPGNNYYRLKQMDKDASFVYSKIIEVLYAGGNTSIEIYPTIVKDRLNINFVKKIGQCNIYDSIGKKMNLRVIEKTNSRVVLDVSGLPKGVYIITYQLDEEMETSKFIKGINE